MAAEPRETPAQRAYRKSFRRRALQARRGCCALLLTSLAAAAPSPSRVAGEPAPAPAESPPPEASQIARSGPFDAGTVVELARTLSRSPYAAARSPVPDSMAKLQYDQYRDIRFRPSATLWTHPARKFRLQFLSLGYLFTTPVEIAIVKDGRAEHLAYHPEMFTAGKLVSAPLPTQDIGFSGFRVLYPLNHARLFDEAAVFQGASYFRSLGRGQAYGLSARGLALKVGDPAGEEFPFFRAFWIEEPSPRSSTLTVHALLDSPSVTGAYRFEIHPGRDTVMRVTVVLFPRVALAQVGIAPGTSMFLFAPNERSGADDYRPRVHDSDGLLMLTGRGEQVWRPLANPTKLQISAFSDRGPRGFGLVQRDRNPADYQDFEARFEQRPTLWVEPSGDWGEGDVILAEIPTDAEIHDNIVAFWRPKQPLAAKSEVHLSYVLSWGGEPSAAAGRVRVLSTAIGRADVRAPTPVRRFVIDYSNDRARCDGRCTLPRAAATASAGKLQDVVVSENPITKGYRVTFTLDPEKSELSELRVDLAFDDARRAEVWLYRWTRP